MSDLTSHLKKWTGRLRSSGASPKKRRRRENRDSGNVVGDGDDHRRGAEGNAFQVNGQPDDIKGEDDDQRHGAEGNAFQVNGEPSD